MKVNEIFFICFSEMADTLFVSEKPLTFDCDLDLGRGNLIFVRDIPSHFSLSFCEIDEIPFISF